VIIILIKQSANSSVRAARRYSQTRPVCYVQYHANCNTK